MKSGIYKLTSPSNKIYIGQSWDIDNRWNRYESLNSATRKQPHLYAALKKYPWSEWKKEIVFLVDNQWLMDQYEIALIRLLKSTDREKGYNLSLGGATGKHSEETKQKIALFRTGKPGPRAGKKTSDETKAKMRLAHKGKKLTEEHKLNISLSRLKKEQV